MEDSLIIRIFLFYDAMNEILEDLDIEIPGHKDEIDYEELEEKS